MCVKRLRETNIGTQTRLCQDPSFAVGDFCAQDSSSGVLSPSPYLHPLCMSCTGRQGETVAVCLSTLFLIYSQADFSAVWRRPSSDLNKHSFVLPRWRAPEYIHIVQVAVRLAYVADADGLGCTSLHCPLDPLSPGQKRCDRIDPFRTVTRL